MSAPARLCTHIMASGATCQSSAVKGTALCYHHSAVQAALGKVTPLHQASYGSFTPIPFVFSEDRASLQINYFLLLQAVNERCVERRAAQLMLHILRGMDANLAKKPLAHVSEPDAPFAEPSQQPGPSESHEESEVTQPPAPAPCPSTVVEDAAVAEETAIAGNGAAQMPEPDSSGSGEDPVVLDAATSVHLTAAAAQGSCPESSSRRAPYPCATELRPSAQRIYNLYFASPENVARYRPQS